MRRAALHRRIEQALVGELSPRHRREVTSHLRSDERARATYDRAVAAFRVLEERPIARWELEIVERWLFDDLDAAAEERPVTRFGWGQLWSVLAAVAAAVVLVVGPLRPDPDDGLRAKGGAVAPLSIEALCGSATSALRPAGEGCPLDGTLSFAYRVDPSRSGVLSLFGIDDEGNVNYYAPTPEDRSAITVESGAWRPVSHAIELPVNHRVGELRLYALLSPRAPTIEQIDALAALLDRLPPAAPGQAPWHLRLAGRSALASLCGPSSCASAQITFRIHEEPS